jgi:hypothetical protein
MIVKAHHALKCENLVRATLPMDTGNLRFNGTKMYYMTDLFYITVGGYKAPYFEFLQNEEKYGKKYNFERRNFAPVYNYLKFALKGKSGGFRYLVQNTMSARQAENIVERTIDVNVVQREKVLLSYTGGR